jgi:hypothetical protein
VRGFTTTPRSPATRSGPRLPQGSSAIAAAALDPGLRRPPRRDRWRRARGPPLHHRMACERAAHGAALSAAPPGPCVEPTHPRDLQEREGRTMDPTHTRPKTPWYAQCAGEPHPRAAANRQAPVPENRRHPQTMAAMDRDEGRKLLGKNPLWTGGVPTEEPADLEGHDKLYAGQRQVGHRASVDTMPRSRAVLTVRTHGRAPPAAEVNRQRAMHPTMGPQTKAGTVRHQSVSRDPTTP